MCGKFTQLVCFDGLSAFADVALAAQDTTQPAETVTPVRLASVICCDPTGKRRVVRMRWGLTPPMTRNVTDKGKPGHIHARAETIDTKPAFREAFASRRGLLVVTSFNEGREITPTKTEQYVLTPIDGAPIAIAVVWERSSPENGMSLFSFAMVTVPPNALIATITDRMPALIEPSDWSLWLGETNAGLKEIKDLLRPSDRPLDMRPAKKPKSTNQPDLF